MLCFLRLSLTTKIVISVNICAYILLYSTSIQSFFCWCNNRRWLKVPCFVESFVISCLRDPIVTQRFKDQNKTKTFWHLTKDTLVFHWIIMSSHKRIPNTKIKQLKNWLKGNLHSHFFGTYSHLLNYSGVCNTNDILEGND